MTNEAYEKYMQERRALQKEFTQRKTKAALAVIGVGLLIVGLLVILGGAVLKNIPITAVVALIALIFTILYARIRVVTINHALQEKLLKLEDRYN